MARMIGEKKAEPKHEKLEEPSRAETIRAFAPIIAIVLIAGLALLALDVLLGGGTREGRCAAAMLPEWKDSCYYSLATGTGNISYCALIGVADKRDTCISAVSMASSSAVSAGYCEQLSSQMLRDNCYSSLAAASGDSSECARVTNSLLRDRCYSDAAATSGDASDCSGIQTQELRYECSNSLYGQQALQQGDPSICERIQYSDPSGAQQLVDGCILSVAMNRSDTSFCTSIANESLRLRCMSPPAVPSDCGVMSDQNQKNLCYFNAAIASKNPSDCGKVPGESLRDNCYYQLAAQARDPSICNGITNENMKNLCVTGAGGS